MQATQLLVRTFHMRNQTGLWGILMQGTDAGHAVYGATLRDVTADAPSPLNTDITWIEQGSWAYSVRLDRVALINGGYGVAMRNRAGADAYPMWCMPISHKDFYKIAA